MPDADPLVSVITPTRNRKSVLAEMLDSIEAQTYPHWEVVVIDDASDDGSWEWLQTRANDSVRIFRQEGQSGTTVTRNAGIRASRGELCLFLDDDDKLPPNGLALHVEALRAQPDAIATVGGIDRFNEKGVVKTVRATTEDRLHHEVWRDVLFSWPFMLGSSVFRRSVLDEIGGFDESLFFYGDDTDLWLRLEGRGPVALLAASTLDYRFLGLIRPPEFFEIQTRLRDRAVEEWGESRRAEAQRVLRARAALFELRRAFGKLNPVPLLRMLVRAWLCKGLRESPPSRFQIRDAVRVWLRRYPLRFKRNGP